MRKPFIFVSLMVLVLFAVSSQSANAQGKRLDSSPQSFKTFFAKFKKAVEKKDKTAIASMTRFPFQWGFDAGNEGTLTKSQFLKKYNEMFDESLKEIVAEKNPMFAGGEGDYVISSPDATHLNFVKIGNNFKFTAFIVEP